MAVAPGMPGDLNGLTWGSVRWSLARTIRIVVDQEVVERFTPSAQYVALVGGADVVVTADQLRTGVGPSDLPAGIDLDTSALWLLQGDDTLSPYAP